MLSLDTFQPSKPIAATNTATIQTPAKLLPLQLHVASVRPVSSTAFSAIESATGSKPSVSVSAKPRFRPCLQRVPRETSIIATATSLTHPVWSRPATAPWYSAPPRWRKMQEPGHNHARRKQDIQVQQESNRKWVLAVCSSPQNGKQPRCARKNLRIKTPHPRIVSWNQLLMMTKVFHLSDFAKDVGTDQRRRTKDGGTNKCYITLNQSPHVQPKSSQHISHNRQKVAHSTEHVHTDVC